MLALRVLFGLFKGLLVGGLLGYGLATMGMATPGAAIAYGAAVGCGMLIALVAGKPIWAKGARIEVGTKVVAGAVLAPAMMWLLRSYATMGLPLDPSSFPGLNALTGPSAAIGTYALTSLALVAGVLGVFFDADNSASANGDTPSATGEAARGRIAEKKERIGQQKTADERAAEDEATAQPRARRR